MFTYLLLGGIDAAGHFSERQRALGVGNRTIRRIIFLTTFRKDKSGQPAGHDQDREKRRLAGGQVLDFLKERGAYENSYIVVESDHNMETNSFIGAGLTVGIGRAGYSEKKIITCSPAHNWVCYSCAGDKDPRRNVSRCWRRALEELRLEKSAHRRDGMPDDRADREEMKTGIDKATGEQVTPPMELYSEY